MSENLKQLHSKVDKFYSNGYLQTWCGSVREEWTEFLDRIFSIIVPSLLPEVEDPIVIDVGCGPSISNIISASKWSKKIYMADYLESNRKEVEAFWKDLDGGFRWDHYFNFLGVLELQPNVKEIENRTRQSIRGVYYCDVTDNKVFHVDDLTGDLVIASLVFDVVAVTDKMFRSCLANVTDNALRQGGLIVIQGSLNEKCYTVGSSVFPVMDISQDRLLDIFRQCGLQVIKFELCIKYSTHYFALCRKNSGNKDE